MALPAAGDSERGADLVSEAGQDPDRDAAVNRAAWSAVNAEYAADHAMRAWRAGEFGWGIFDIPERELGVLGRVAGLDVVELGCGTAYLSAWLARQGARPVGVDITHAQLRTARRCQEWFGVRFPLVEADAGQVPLAAGSFDLAVSARAPIFDRHPRPSLPPAPPLRPPPLPPSFP